MPPSPVAAALAFVACGVLVTGIWAWLVAGAKVALTNGLFRKSSADRLDSLLQSLGFAPRLPLIPWTPRRPAPWAFIDLVLLIGVWIVASVVAAVALGFDSAVPPLDQQKAQFIGSSAVSILIVAIGLPLIALRSGANLKDFGISPAEFWSDVRLGVIGFVMLAPPVYALQGLLVYFWKPSEHPLIEAFKKEPDPGFFVLLFLSAAAIAPLVEEVLFRVLQQGFLEKWFTFDHSLHDLLVGNPHRHKFGRSSAVQQSPIEAVAVPGENPYSSPSVAALAESKSPNPERLQPELKGASAWLSIAASAAVFALLHLPHGPDWIPLFFLAIGMGYLYQRTHRILPGLIVHALLNALSMWGLWVQMKEGISP